MVSDFLVLILKGTHGLVYISDPMASLSSQNGSSTKHFILHPGSAQGTSALALHDQPPCSPWCSILIYDPCSFRLLLSSLLVVSSQGSSVPAPFHIPTILSFREKEDAWKGEKQWGAGGQVTPPHKRKNQSLSSQNTDKDLQNGGDPEYLAWLLFLH